MAFDTLGNLYVVDGGNYIVRKIDTAGIVSTIGGMQGNSISRTLDNNGDGAQATSTRFLSPHGVCVNDNYLYMTDYGNDWIRTIDLTTGIITTLAGNTIGNDADGIGTFAYMNQPTQCAVVTAGTIVVADHGNDKVKSIVTSTRLVTTMATVTGAFSVWVDSTSMVYVGTDRYTILRRSFSTAGGFSTIAGQSTVFGLTDGTGTNALFGSINGLWDDTDGNLYITDYEHHVVRKMRTTSPRVVTTIAGNSTAGSTGDGGDAFLATFNLPYGVILDASGTKAKAKLDCKTAISG